MAPPTITFGYRVFLIASMLVTGTINTIVSKSLYQAQFAYPWTMTLVMFCAEATLLPFFIMQTARRRRAANGGSTEMAGLIDDDGNDGGAASATTTTKTAAVRGLRELGWKNAIVCAIPAAFDIFASAISAIGLLYVTASSYQMLRGAVIIATGGLSAVFLKKKLRRFELAGMALAVLGVALVGAAGYVASADTQHAHAAAATTQQGNEPPTSARMKVVGVVLVLVAQILGAGQMVVEEKFLKGRDLPPAFVVGCEGVSGCLLMVCIVLPITAHLPGDPGQGIHEDALTAASRITQSGLALGLVLTFFTSVAYYNFVGQSVTKHLSAVHRVLVDTCRTPSVWGVSLVLWYSTGSADGETTRYGAGWTAKGSWIQLAGFLVLVAGSFVYYQVVRPPCLYTDSAAEASSGLTDEEDEEAGGEAGSGGAYDPPPPPSGDVVQM